MMDARRLTKRCKDLLAAGKARIRCKIAVVDEANRVPVQKVVTEAEQEVRDRHADVFLFGGDDNARQSLLDALEDMCLALGEFAWPALPLPVFDRSHRRRLQ